MKVPFLNLYKATFQIGGTSGIAVVAAVNENEARTMLRELPRRPSGWSGWEEGDVTIEELPGRYQGMPGGTVLVERS